MKENVCLLLHAHVCSVCGLLIIILKEIVKIVIFMLLKIVHTSLERFQASSLCNVWSYVFIILLKLEFGRKITVPYVCPNGQTYAGVTDNARHCRQNILDGLSLGMFVFMVAGWDGSRRQQLDRGCQLILKICQDWVFDEAKGCWHSKANLSLWLLELIWWHFGFLSLLVSCILRSWPKPIMVPWPCSVTVRPRVESAYQSLCPWPVGWTL